MLTPLDIENVKFRGALSGYDRGEVEQFRARMIQALENYIAQVTELRGQIAGLEDRLARYHESEELLKNSVVLAQRTADELIATAHQRADVIIQSAQLEGEGVRQSLGKLRAEREQFEYQFHGLLTGFIRQLEQNNPGLTHAQAALASPPPLPQPEPHIPASFPASARQSPLPAAPAQPQPPVGPTSAPAEFSPVQRPAVQPQNPQDTDISSLTALLNAVKPVTLSEMTPPVTSSPPASTTLQESFAPASETGTQDQA